MSELAVKVSDLHFNYSDKPNVLDGAGLTIKRGETVAIVGPNGAGKTTLFLHLNALLQPISGSVEVLGVSLADNREHKAIRKRVGIVFQNPEDQLFCPTVFDDVAFGPLNHGLSIDLTHDRVDAALQAVDMLKVVNRPSHHLSFGEKRLVAIATVLASEPELILLDEPSSNLDPHAQRKLVKLINDLPLTKIIASHDFELILQTCKRVLVMNRGKITEDGTPEEILFNETLLRRNGLEMPYLIKKLKAKVI